MSERDWRMGWRRRSRIAAAEVASVTQQRRRALGLLWFGGVRIVIWTVLALFVGLGLARVGGFDWARLLAGSVPFVALISLYANWATDVDGATAAFAALVAADAHRAAAITVQRQLLDTEALERDIARLADLHPGEEAGALADDIRLRIRPTSGPEARL